MNTIQTPPLAPLEGRGAATAFPPQGLRKALPSLQGEGQGGVCIFHTRPAESRINEVEAICKGIKRTLFIDDYDAMENDMSA